MIFGVFCGEKTFREKLFSPPPLSKAFQIIFYKINLKFVSLYKAYKFFAPKPKNSLKVFGGGGCGGRPIFSKSGLPPLKNHHLSNHLEKLGFGNYRYTEFTCFCELTSRIVACDDVIGLF